MKGSSRKSCDAQLPATCSSSCPSLNEGQLPKELRLGQRLGLQPAGTEASMKGSSRKSCDWRRRTTPAWRPSLNEGQLPKELRHRESGDGAGLRRASMKGSSRKSCDWLMSRHHVCSSSLNEGQLPKELRRRRSRRARQSRRCLNEGQLPKELRRRLTLCCPPWRRPQ